MLMQILSSWVLFLSLVSVESHDWDWGACPRVDAQPTISLNKFLGLWYVIEQFDTSSSCYVYNFTRVSDTQLKVTKGRQFDVLLNAGLEHTTAYTGSLDIPSAEDQGRMRVKWPANIMGKGDYIIVSTDYTGYAGIYDCQPITALAHRQSAAILSRTPELDQIYVDKVKRKLMSFGVDDHDFDKIDHSTCVVPSESTVNLAIDENTLKNLFNKAVDGAKNVGSTIVDTSKNLYEEGKKRLGMDDSDSTVIRPRPQNYFDPDAEIIV